MSLDKDIMDKYDIRVNYIQAKRIHSLINEYVDFSKLTVGDVLDLNYVLVQLEDVIQEEEAMNV